MRAVISRFASDQRGAVTVLALLIFLLILIVGGLGVDLMANEMKRARLQRALDAAALAAANLNVQAPPAEVLEGYLERSIGDTEALRYDIEDNGGYRRVFVEFDSFSETNFMRLVGVDTLGISVASEAHEQRVGVEVSLVLDISSSMHAHNRLNSLKAAARDFVDVILTEETEELATINLVPYGGAVNFGDAMSEILGMRELADLPRAPHNIRHAYRSAPPNDRSCLNMRYMALRATSLSQLYNRQQLPRFSYWYSPRTNPWCPRASSRVIYASSERDRLKEHINGMTMSDGTSSQFALHAGLLFLEPSSRNIFSQLHQRGELQESSLGRLLSYDAGRKYIVLMTDGGISEQFRPRDPFGRRNEYRRLGRTHYNAVKWRAHWQAKEDFRRLCDFIRQNRNITIYTVAMDNPVAVNHMRYCASSSSHFFFASGADIRDTFASIANSIRKDAIRLIR